MGLDYTKFSTGGSSGDANSSVYVKRWWSVPAGERAQAIAGIVKQMSEYDSKRQTQYQISTRLYGNSNLMGLNGLSYSKIMSVNNSLKDRMSYNVVQSATDTIIAKMSKNKPRPLFLTSGGDSKLQRKAKKLDQFVDGIFYENDAYHLGPVALRDGCVFGDGFVHVYDYHGRVKFERVIPSELYVDWVESFYGEPRQIHRVKNIDRHVLIDMFPSKRKEILMANSASADLTGQYQNVADQITVVESWHLPSGPDATDGRHSIIIPESTLFDEKYDKPFFPFAQFSWCPRMYGFWGQGLAEQIQNIQLEINKILWVIQRSFHLAGSFKVFLENGSKIVKEHISNDIGGIVNYTGTPPIYMTPQIVAAEMYQHLATLKSAAFEQAGVSQLSASSLKPQGLNSGKALREYNDIESDRFMTIGQAYERFFLQLSKIAIDVAKDIYSEDKKYPVKVPGKRFIDTIDWKDIDLEDDEYIMKAFPVSSLPNEPAGRLETITEYIQAGFINPRTGRRLLDFPDLEQVEGLANAKEDYINQILDKIVEDGDYTDPEPYDDLQLCLELALEYYAQGKLQNLDPLRLDLIQNFIKKTQILIQKSQPPPMPMQGTAPGGQAQPQANPMPTPQSPLVQNTAGAA